jgi:DNA-binding PadR family transcriptional regulator
MPDKRPLTDNEGALLSLVLREQPITGYQIGKCFENSPVHTFNTSKGKLYPLIHRLEARGLLAAQAVPGDQRGTQQFVCTAAGKDVLKNWVQSIRPENELLPDPLRKKVQAFGLLSRSERLEWVEAAIAQLERKLAAVEAWPAESEGAFGALVTLSARSALEARLQWLHRVREHVDSPEK